VLMIQPPTDKIQLKTLDTLHIETIIIYTGERAPSNGSLFFFDHIPSLLDRSNALYEHNREKLIRIQELCIMRQQLQQQQTEQTDQTQQHHQLMQMPPLMPLQSLHNDIGTAAALSDEVIVISDDDGEHPC